MADWQGELAALLASLDVSMEGAADTTERPAAPSECEQEMVPAPRTGDLAAIVREEAAGDADEVSAIRSEIEATISRVMELASAGLIERSLRDDVIYVLKALTRPAPPYPRSPLTRRRRQEFPQEWNLASAAAVLRFCRLVLHLTNAIAPE